MALLYEATLVPSKQELLASWLPSRSWFAGDADALTRLGAYRFDDPAGEVGVESFLLQSSDGAVLHVPVTYRAEPMLGAEELLLGTTEHSVLGTRWVYDACGDPVYAGVLASAVLTGGTQAEEQVERSGSLETREPSMTVQGSGRAEASVDPVDTLTCHDEGQVTVIRAGALELVVVHVLGADPAVEHTLTGTWGDGSAVLAGVRPA